MVSSYSPELQAKFPVTHEPHTVAVAFRHDSLNMLVAVAMCTEGRCTQGTGLHTPNGRGPLWERYQAAGMEAGNYPPHPELDFWEYQEVHRLMASLRLAEHEGRQKTVDWCREKLVALARTPPRH